jgi:hypothetical protein
MMLPIQLMSQFHLKILERRKRGGKDWWLGEIQWAALKEDL